MEASLEFPEYRITAVNDARDSENRIHSDDIARAMGFSGALVSGVSLYGYMTHPLVARLGPDWLSYGMVEVRFLKPAYEGDELLIQVEPPAPDNPLGRYRVTTHNEQGDLLAVLESWQPDELPPVSDWGPYPERGQPPDRKDISWDNIEVGRHGPLRDLAMWPNIQNPALDLMRDNLELYHEGKKPYMHPYVLLKECNMALMSLYNMPAWIHVGSRLIIRAPIRLDDLLCEVFVPIDKWRRKGHEFVRTYHTYWSECAQVALEVEHTAIYRIAQA